MPTATFTVRWIEGLTSEGKQAYFWDVRQQGFGLRLSPTGRLSFLVQYRIKGTPKRRRLVLGPYGVLTLDEARNRARQYVSAGLDGLDLKAEREAKRKSEGGVSHSTSLLTSGLRCT